MILTRDATTVTIDTRADYPYAANYEVVQARDKSASGVVHVESFNVSTSTYTFSYQRILEADYLKILDWFINVAEGMLNTFSLTDDLGVVRTVRFLSPTLNFQLVSYKRWSGSFTVEEVI